jgi:transposase InsO family protein
VLLFYDELGVDVGAVLTDNGREFCGRPEQHPYELLLAVEGIEHRTTRVRGPQTNGFVERMNRTLLDECFRVKCRTTWYMAPEEIQRDLDVFIAFYNEQRTHQGLPAEVTNARAGPARGTRRRAPAGLRAARQPARGRGRHHARRDDLKPQAQRPDCRGITEPVQLNLYAPRNYRKYE